MQPPPAYVIVFLVATMLVVVAVLAMLLIMILMNEKRRRHYEQTLASLKTEHQASILQTQVEIQEQTFTNISREIHDHVQLSLVLAKLNLYNQQPQQAAAETHAQTIALIDDAITNLSDISKSLNADLIQGQGLLKALEGEVVRINRSAGLKLTLTVAGEPVFLPASIELVLFRIAQEAINNMLKHAGASGALIRISFEAEQLHMRIADNGKGFDPAQPHKAAGAGLRNIEARTKLFGGTFSIQSAPEQGTTLTVSIPITSPA